MDALLYELAWFLPWCWLVNMSFTIWGYAARSYPPLARIDRPLDGGWVFMRQRLLGDSTTWGGLLLAMLLGTAGALLAPGHHLFVLAVLVFMGHALGSFAKRRLSMARGTYLPFVDHVDYLILIALASPVLGFPSVPALLIASGVTFLVTPLVTYGGYKAGIRAHKL